MLPDLWNRERRLIRAEVSGEAIDPEAIFGAEEAAAISAAAAGIKKLAADT